MTPDPTLANTPDAGIDPWRGLGPTSRAWLAAAGVRDAAALRAADPVTLYLRIRAAQPGASLNLLFALVGAQTGRDWREVARQRRSDLLLELDLRRAAATPAGGGTR